MLRYLLPLGIFLVLVVFFAVGLIVGLGYLYYRISGGSAALAAIGLISFAGVAQFLPAMVLGTSARATRRNAMYGAATFGSGLSSSPGALSESIV